LKTAESCLWKEESSDSISNDEWIDDMECGSSSSEGPWADFEDSESQNMHWPVTTC